MPRRLLPIGLIVICFPMFYKRGPRQAAGRARPRAGRQPGAARPPLPCPLRGLAGFAKLWSLI